MREIIEIFIAWLRVCTFKRGIGAHGCTIQVAVGKDKAITLQRMGATHANIIRIAEGNFPTRRNVHRLLSILNKRAIVDFVTMKSHVQVGAVALKRKRKKVGKK